jgi:hypothetical protein
MEKKTKIILISSGITAYLIISAKAKANAADSKEVTSTTTTQNLHGGLVSSLKGIFDGLHLSIA